MIESAKHKIAFKAQMKAQMREYRTNEIAQTCNVTVNTVRNWCKEFGQFLSSSATVTSGHRRFTERDRAVLSYIAQLRSENMQSEDVAQRLSETSFPDIEPVEQPVTELAPVDQPEPLVAVPDGHHNTQALLVALQTMQTQIEALQQGQRHAVYYIAIGIGVGLGLALVFELMAIIVNRAP